MAMMNQVRLPPLFTTLPTSCILREEIPTYGLQHKRRQHEQ